MNIQNGKIYLRIVSSILVLSLAGRSAEAAIVSGQVTASGGGAISGARVTLFTQALDFFREVRTNASGNYQFDTIPDGSYRLGVSSRGREYQEVTVLVSGGTVSRSFSLAPETNMGRWSIVGNTAPEYLEGTGWGTLLPTGEIFFCHDSNDPIVFDTVSQTKWFPVQSGITQGCHLETLELNGDLFIAGGSTAGLPQSAVIKTSKIFRRNSDSWVIRADMNEGRWYPGGVRLPDERLLAIGGEGQPDGYNRLNTCEIYNPANNTWTPTGSFNLPSEIPNSVLLMNGEVFKTWRYPEIYNLTTGLWRAAANMVQARLGAPGGNHSDHEMVYLPDGRVMTIGIDPTAGVTNPSMVEFYNSSLNQWTKGPTPPVQRQQPEAALLPDGRVLAFGGTYTGAGPSPVVLKNAGQVQNCTNVADLFDPATNAWRPMATSNRWMHYHNVTVLAPDGRIFATGGAGTGTALNFGDDSSIETFEPPYLFRGVRPRIDSLSTPDLTPGRTFTLNVSRTSGVTEVLLLGARAASHWVDLGPQRSLSLPFSQAGSQVTATVPASAVTALPGWYLLFAMVDDIPSEARIVRITAAATAPAIPSLPTVSVVVTDASAAEAGLDPAVFTVSRTGSTATPMTFFYSMGGMATEGLDYNALPGFVTIPAGSASATVTVTPKEDLLVEGNETIILTLSPRVHYAVGSPSNATAVLLDNDSADSDGDGLPDAWELQYFGNLNQGPSDDPDGDGLSNAAEYAAGTDPTKADTDGDGITDGAEVAAGFDPLNPDQNGNGILDGLEDWDGDGILNQNDPTPGSVPGGAPPSAGGGGNCGLLGVELVLPLGLVSFYKRRRKIFRRQARF